MRQFRGACEINHLLYVEKHLLTDVDARRAFGFLHDIFDFELKQLDHVLLFGQMLMQSFLFSL